jgi:hypothetical protein
VKFKRALLPAAGALLAFVALAECLLWLLPPPHRRLEYMIAGTAATALALGVTFAMVGRLKPALPTSVRKGLPGESVRP